MRVPVVRLCGILCPRDDTQIPRDGETAYVRVIQWDDVIQYVKDARLGRSAPGLVSQLSNLVTVDPFGAAQYSRHDVILSWVNLQPSRHCAAQNSAPQCRGKVPSYGQFN